MIDLNRIPPVIYNTLVELAGQKKADKYIIDRGYNYLAIQQKIYILWTRNYIKKNPYISFVIIILILSFFYMYFYDFIHY